MNLKKKKSEINVENTYLINTYSSKLKCNVDKLSGI